MFKKYSILILSFVCHFSSVAQTLQRKAFIGIIAGEKSNQIIIDSVLANSTAEKLGLKKRDVLQSINSKQLKNLAQFQGIAAEIRADDAIKIAYLRNGKLFDAAGVAIAKPLHKAEWCDILYQSLPAIGCTVRTIIYKPKNKTKTPGIFFIPGYNCGSIENYASNFNGKMIEGWVKKGYTVYTVEKSGLGDSKACRPCVEVDLQTDIELFETAYSDFASVDFVDKRNLFIWGHSMGGIIAPLIVHQKPVRGIMVFGTVFRPWSEFLLEMHRVQKPLLDSLTFDETETFTRLIQKVYYEFFILKKTPAELHKNPEYKKIVETELEFIEGKQDMWGRHWRFWQQLDSINLAKAWQNMDCKVLVLHGGSDFIQCSAVESYLIAETVNKSHKGNATMITIPGVDHLIMNSKDYPEAVRNMNNKEYLKGNFNTQLLNETIRWMERL